MSKNIAISDNVYEMLKSEKGDKSFSEVIEEKVDSGKKIADVSGMKILDEGAYEDVKEDIRGLTEGTAERLEE